MSLNDLKEMRKFVSESAKKQKQLEKLKADMEKNNSITRAVDRKLKFLEEMNKTEKRFVLNPAYAIFPVFFIAIFFFCESIYKSAFAAHDRYVESNIGISDYKKAAKFVNCLLEGKIEDGNSLFRPGIPESSRKNAGIILNEYKGSSVSEVMLQENRKDEAVFKVVCPRGEEAALIYLTLKENHFYISNTEREMDYAAKQMSDN